jgi:hypothetical protein
MSEQEKNESFFRKVVRFVANPATDWADLNTRQEDTKELELEKSELKAMIERKRRNDFVRKREFDMLRRVRREGLSPEQLATLGTSSRLDDSGARQSEAARRPGGVKAKIDESRVVPVEEALRLITRSAGQVRTRLLAIPAKAAALLEGKGVTERAAVIRQEVDDALAELQRMRLERKR